MPWEVTMPARNPEIEQALAEAIRNGADRRPEQAFGDYFHGRHASCALGAAYEGMFRLPANMEGRRPTKDLEEYFDCLDGTVRRCPGEACRKVLTLAALIVHLNDEHRWTREQIAAWVADERAATPPPAP
ncbi:MAG: hypothetical protein AB7U83_15150 [Vicinamibacterales bacterium]